MLDILMATYNGEKYIQQQIESIINQNYSDWNLYIHDDGSSDKTIEIIKQIKDSRIHLVEDNIHFGNSSLNFLHLVKTCATNDYFFFVDQDDFWLPIKIEKTLSLIKQIENGDKSIPICVGTDLKVVDSELNMINESFYELSKMLDNADFNSLLIENDFTGCTMCMNKSVIPYLKKISESDYSKIIQHDWLISLICAADGKISQLAEPTMLYRQHQNNVVGANGFSATKMFQFSTLKNRLSKIKKLKKQVFNQLELTKSLIKNEDDKFLIEKYISTSGLKHKFFMIKNKIIRSKKTVKSLVKLFLY